MAIPYETSWLWVIDNDRYGAQLDADAAQLRWYDTVGCSCGDSLVDQPLAEFLAKGAPLLLPTPPDDVLQEIEMSVKQAVLT